MKIDQKKYKLGYAMAVMDDPDLEHYEWLKVAAEECESFILGIPDSLAMARLFGDGKAYSDEMTRDYLQGSGRFEKVLILDAEHLSYQRMYGELHFDICFYGSEYGLPFENDRRFMESHHVEFRSFVPEKRIHVDGGGSLRLALEDLQRRQKIILFGTGVYFDLYQKEYASLGKRFVPAYAIDNDETKWNTEKMGIMIRKPSALKDEDPENVLIVLCSKKYEDMITQLKGYGDFNYRSLSFCNSMSLLEEFAIVSAEERAYLQDSHRILELLMKEFDRVCQEHDLHYYIICGSLIGVVRHRGFIPWDDDIDIAMPRGDFKKLKKIARKVWNNDTFKFLNWMDIGGGAFLDCMPRLFYMKEHLPTKCFDKIAGKATADIEDRMFLDIYIMDSAHKSDKMNALITNCMKGIYNLMMGHRGNIDYEEYRAIVSDKIIKWMKRIHRIGRFLPIRFLAFWYEAFARSGNFNRKAPDYIMQSCAIRCIELKYPKAHFGEGQRLPFEGISVMVPSDYDAQLNAMRYRNYMEFPRMSIRKPSHYFNSDIEIW